MSNPPARLLSTSESHARPVAATTIQFHRESLGTFPNCVKCTFKCTTAWESKRKSPNFSKVQPTPRVAARVHALEAPAKLAYEQRRTAGASLARETPQKIVDWHSLPRCGPSEGAAEIASGFLRTLWKATRYKFNCTLPALAVGRIAALSQIQPKLGQLHISNLFRYGFKVLNRRDPKSSRLCHLQLPDVLHSHL